MLEHQEKEEKQREREPYVTPRVLRYGSLSTIIRGTGASGYDNNTGTGTCCVGGESPDCVFGDQNWESC